MTVSLVGLPGAGKTTLSKLLAQRLGWRSFLLGEALRARAANDPDLKKVLDRGDLAPEPIALGLVEESARNAVSQGLIVDGFPRHPAQVELASKWFDSWVVLYLDIDAPTAAKRIVGRLSCPGCGWVGVQVPADRSCPTCGAQALQSRGEDEPGVVMGRLMEAVSRLDALLQHLRDVRVIRLDASRPVNEVLDSAIVQLTHVPPWETASNAF
jgi:adenylate kinase